MNKYGFSKRVLQVDDHIKSSTDKKSIYVQEDNHAVKAALLNALDNGLLYKFYKAIPSIN